MRGSAVTLAQSLSGLGGWRPDLVFVSDMVDLAQFRTFSRRFIGDPPTVLYMHESQLTYPTSPGTEPDFSYAMTNWLSAYAADHVLFNSEYHRTAFFEALPRLLRNFPDLTHVDLIENVAERSDVLPVGVDLSWIGRRCPDPHTAPPRILWNHRWDHDKGPDAFAGAVGRLVERGIEFDLVLLGARPPHDPTPLTQIRDVAGDRIVHDGEAQLPVYRRLVGSCDLVVSTARQEFFGVSVVEAIAAGCRPVLPNRLSYPGLIPPDCHHMVLYEEGDLVQAMTTALADPVPPPGLKSAVASFSWDRMAPRYDNLLETLAL
jgi:glycosyltransferase involved in cell wall biosynthesis